MAHFQETNSIAIGSFEDVVSRYSGMAYQLAHRVLFDPEESKEVVQESFIKIYKNWHQIDPDANLKNWIYTVTLNTARDHYRRAKKRLEMNARQWEYLPQQASGNDIGDRLFVRRLLGELPYKLREVVVLHYVEGLSVKEISAMLQYSVSLVKVRLFRARKYLVENFSGDYCEV